MQKGDLQEKVKSMQGKVWYYLTTYLGYIKKLQVGRYLGTDAYFTLWHGTFSHKEGIEPIRSSFESRRKRGEANSILRGSIWYAGQMVSLMDSLFFVHVSKYMYVPTSSQPARLSSYIRKILVRGLFTTESVLVCSRVVNTTQRRTCIHAFQVVFQHATKCFNKLCLVCYLVSFFLSPSFSPLPARSIWRWLHLSVRS